MFRTICFFFFFPFPIKPIISPPIISDDFNKWKTSLQNLTILTNHRFGWGYDNCNLSVTPTTTTIHNLSPMMIGAVGALGDSISVAQAARSMMPSDLAQQFRGINFVTGSDVTLQQEATLFNIFRKFHANVKGGSSDRIKKFYDFNLAKSGATSDDLPRQTDEILKTLRATLGNDFDVTWKFINIFIGHNDLCKFCVNETHFTAENYANNMRKSLEKLKSQAPKLFINVMPPINVFLHSKTGEISNFCKISHRSTCPCLFKKSAEDFAILKHKINTLTMKLIDSIEETADFAIVYNPTFDLESFPTIQTNQGNVTNLAFIALDCFHFSSISHDILAKQIWKSLFDPISMRPVIDLSRRQPILDRFVCPPQSCPFLRTRKNSLNCNQIVRANSYSEENVADNSSFWIFVSISTISILLILVLVLYSTRRRRRQKSDDGEFQHLLTSLPIRADLNDNIF